MGRPSRAPTSGRGRPRRRILTGRRVTGLDDLDRGTFERYVPEQVTATALPEHDARSMVRRGGDELHRIARADPVGRELDGEHDTLVIGGAGDGRAVDGRLPGCGWGRGGRHRRRARGGRGRRRTARWRGRARGEDEEEAARGAERSKPGGHRPSTVGARRVFRSAGGEGGIRTRDGLPHTAFPVRRARPLRDLSARNDTTRRARPVGSCVCVVAERVGFEPTLAFTRPLFESGTINHSDTSPPRGSRRSPEPDHRPGPVGQGRVAASGPPSLVGSR